MYVYYNCTRVLCECHGYRRDRESSRVSVKWLVECDQTCNQPPRPPDRSGIIMLKLKRKLQIRGHVYFQAVQLELIQQVLNWLKVHNPLYKDILVDINSIDSNLTALQNDAEDNDTHQQATSNNVTKDSGAVLEYDAKENDKFNSNQEENDDPLNEYRASVCETCLESMITNYLVVLHMKPEWMLV